MADATHFFHTTERHNLASIVDEGLLPHRPSHRGEQEDWPDRGRNQGPSRGGRVYLADTETQAHNFQADHTNVMLRVAREKLTNHPAHKEHGTGDYFTTKKIVPEHLEIREGADWKLLKTPAIAKALANIHEIGNDERGILLRVEHPDHPGDDNHAIRVGVCGIHGKPDSHKYVAGVFPVKAGKGKAEMGPAVVRQVARHLRDHYGVTHLEGTRVSGVHVEHAKRLGSYHVTRDISKAFTGLLRKVTVAV